MTPATSPQLAREPDHGRSEALRKQNETESAVFEEDKAEAAARSQKARELEAFEKLTPRLQEVLRLIAKGLSTKAIAVQLNISNKTVEFHRSRLMKQLGIRTIAQLARYAVRVGAIPP